MRLTAIALLAIAAGAAPAVAGDFADREILGFSANGSTFAFEEYGVEDGSGFPFSNTYIIDTANDSWVKGSPIRLREENESRPLSNLRFEARNTAKPLLQQRGVGTPGTLVASNPPTETSADPHNVAFQPRLIVPPSGTSMTLQIAESPMPAEGCPADMGPYKSFSLVLAGSGGPTVIHTDSAIPKSRKCPTGYAISDVVTLYPDGAAPVMAVIVSIYSVGFEGPNRRFLAVTTQFQE